MASHRWTRLLRDAGRALAAVLGRARRRPPAGRPAPGRPERAPSYPGDFTGVVRPVYSPHPDGAPDPGEIVWTWVPFEEDHTRGKDRPVLLVGHDGPWLLGLQLTSKNHDRDAAQEARFGRLWMDIGSGPWDARGRPSEVRVNRVVRVAPDDVRREGAVLDAATFRQVVDTMGRARR
ncbi:type II toxin-antitoxin system PemK/MazF family toxin [Isoptericola sediminis]|uniref:Type II toxin-antitoxin system PemK/MazF family toxin n=1 Tax=Isoptericola sediminis TaxID=2733572 RepID=A0A849KIB8_9MICO|nr:type II toxin-antitoxin system PemK/MazF family toxin [Isoptericola sediminis]NNU28393.1 type II toxin-antitoxin system PemK/MazF family toxin [Isoptericola sediminis]